MDGIKKASFNMIIAVVSVLIVFSIVFVSCTKEKTVSDDDAALINNQVGIATISFDGGATQSVVALALNKNIVVIPVHRLLNDGKNLVNNYKFKFNTKNGVVLCSDYLILDYVRELVLIKLNLKEHEELDYYQYSRHVVKAGVKYNILTPIMKLMPGDIDSTTPLKMEKIEKIGKNISRLDIRDKEIVNKQVDIVPSAAVLDMTGKIIGIMDNEHGRVRYVDELLLKDIDD